MKQFSKIALLAFGFGLLLVALSSIPNHPAAAAPTSTVTVDNTAANPVPVRDQNKKESPECTVANLEGGFGFTFTGTARTPDGPSPRAGVGRFTFDGQGTFLGTQTTVADGRPGRRTFVGTYTVDSDCTGSGITTFPDGGRVFFDFVIDDEGREFRYVVTPPADAPRPLTVTLIARKQFPTGDSGVLK